jgi:copper homeostasis protein
MLVEVCANSLESALNAEKCGADRIELCSELAVGGITPSYGLLKTIKADIKIPVHVLIRPRSGDFSYTKGEFDIMLRNIALCVKMGFDGIVSGVLNKDLTLDVDRTKKLIEASGDLKFTFHRAFDWVLNPTETLKQLEDLGVDYILSSGQKKSALEGIGLLSELNWQATSCTIMPGSGVNAYNVLQFKTRGFQVVHLSGTVYEQRLNTIPNISMNSPSFLRDDGVFVSNVEVLRKVVHEVK